MVLADCGESPEEEERFAFLGADNQTGDAAVDWTTGVLHRGLSAAVGSSIAPDTVADARVSTGGANRIVYSTLTRGGSASDGGGELRLHSAIFDAVGHRFNREYTVTGDSLQVINRMGTAINPKSSPLGAKSVEVLRKWPVLAGSDIGAFENQCLELAESEPAFGAALGSCAEQLTSNNRPEALRRLLSRVQPEQSRGFSVDVQETFGQSFMALKQYPDAAVVFRAASAERPTIKNILGYAEALSGRCDVAKHALEEYSRVPGQEPNALDSLGEVSFLCEKYGEAEQYFLAAEPKLMGIGSPQGVLEPFKAAAAKSMAGDSAGADKLANAALDKLGKSNPQAVATLKPLWGSISKAGSPEERKRMIEGSLIRRP